MIAHRERPAVQELKNGWSNRQRRARSWVLSLARRLTFSRYWMPSRQMPHGLCDATDAQIRLVYGDGTRLCGILRDSHQPPQFRSMTLGSVSARAILNRETVHIQDLQEERKHGLSDSTSSETRTFLSTPMLREGTPIGAMNIRRTEVRPFSEKQIKLLETFARPSRDRHRERAVVQRAKGVVGAADRDERRSWGPSPARRTDVQPVSGRGRWSMPPGLCDATDARDSSALTETMLRPCGLVTSAVAGTGGSGPINSEATVTRAPRAIIDRRTLHHR